VIQRDFLKIETIAYNFSTGIDLKLPEITYCHKIQLDLHISKLPMSD
jgi:hypothetical protein